MMLAEAILRNEDIKANKKNKSSLINRAIRIRV